MMVSHAATMDIHIAAHAELGVTGIGPTSACCAGTSDRALHHARTAAARRHLLVNVDELISDLTDTSQTQDHHRRHLPRHLHLSLHRKLQLMLQMGSSSTHIMATTAQVATSHR